MENVAIVYHYFAHYRLPILSQLAESDKVNYTFVSGTESDTPIEKIDFSKSYNSHLKWLKVENYWFLKKKFLWQSGLFSILLKGNFQSVVFLGSPYIISSWFGIFICRLRRIKVYYWMHGFYSDEIKIVDLVKIYIYYKLANGFFLYGNRAASFLQKYKVKPSQDIHVIYNSLDYFTSKQLRKSASIEEIKQFRDTFFSASETPIVSFIGRLNEVKKIDYLIKAQNLLRNEDGECLFNLLIIGGGESLANLKQLCIDYNLTSNVCFVGALYNEDEISEKMIFSDLCVVPGEIGLTAIHALSYGTPVISHDNLNIQMPEIEAIENGVTGLLYHYNNIDDLALKIEEWIVKNPIKTPEIVQECYKIIDAYYNPYYQSKVMEDVLTNL